MLLHRLRAALHSGTANWLIPNASLHSFAHSPVHIRSHLPLGYSRRVRIQTLSRFFLNQQFLNRQAIHNIDAL